LQDRADAADFLNRLVRDVNDRLHSVDLKSFLLMRAL
jgi:hypothetical protein